MNGFLPLLLDTSEAATIAFYTGRIIDRKTFLFHVEKTRKILPKNKYNINICDNRYHFLVTFAASTSNRQISLLPSSRASLEIERLGKLYKDYYIIDDSVVQSICEESLKESYEVKDNIFIKEDQVVSVVFTSGSTGIPKANPKTWRQLFESANRVRDRFNIDKGQQHTIVATVPPQHMFGFETTIVYPLMLGVAIHSGRPFYPLDIQQALFDIPAPRILVTTPLHLKACNSEECGWPEIDFVISATAPLSTELAIDAERILNTRVFEIYGCSEAGAIGTRQTSKEIDWHILNEYKISIMDDITTLDAPGYNDVIQIPDNIEISDCYFKLMSRNSDLIKIGGKRASLTDLTKILKNIDGVNDAIIIMPDEIEGKRLRLAAFAVVSDTEENKLRIELSKFIDRIFIPRPLIIVKRLPYNELGKIPRTALLELLADYLKKYDYLDIA